MLNSELGAPHTRHPPQRLELSLIYRAREDQRDTLAIMRHSATGDIETCIARLTRSRKIRNRETWLATDGKARTYQR